MQQPAYRAERQSATTWVLIANGRQVDAFDWHKENHRGTPLCGTSPHACYEEVLRSVLTPVSGLSLQAEPLSDYELGNGGKGAIFSSAGTHRHSVSPHHSLKDKIHQHFVMRLIKKLVEARADGRFDRLIIVAPARMVGELRGELPAAVQKTIIAVLPKDLVHLARHELLIHLDELTSVPQPA
ncbi:MAG: host attachment protein [Bdellovibrionales bacterium]